MSNFDPREYLLALGIGTEYVKALIAHKAKNVLDIVGGTTDIAVVDNGGVEGTKMFSIGGRAFTHQIAETLGLDFDDAEKMKLLEGDPRMKPAIRKKVETAIARNLTVWISGVQIAIEEFDHVETLPAKVLLCGGGASLTEIPETLATSDWYEGLGFARRPAIHLIDPEDVPGILNSTGRQLDHTFVTAMGLLRVVVDTIVGTSVKTGLLAKLTKLLRN